ncbi:USE1 family protein [Megaselia abdita]
MSKLEVRFRSLLINCEELSNDELNYPRIRKFIRSLERMMEELREFHDSDSQMISNYYFRLNNLKTITNFTEMPPSGTEKINKMKSKVNEALENRQIENSKLFSLLRKELINDDTLRRRKPGEGSDMEQAMKYYSDTQEKIAENMLLLTQNLKEQTETANRIIRKDTYVVKRSAEISDKNLNSLTKEADKLQDHSKNAFKCWMWIMIIFVMAVFIG